MENPPESPFKKDEPVSGSWKWMLLTAAAGVAWFCFMTWKRWERMASFEDFLQELLFLLIDAAIVGFLIRAVRIAAESRRKRNFEVMASAVRGQRPFWMLLAVAGAAGSIYCAVQVLQAQSMNDYIKRWLKEHPSAAPSAP